MARFLFHLGTEYEAMGMGLSALRDLMDDICFLLDIKDIHAPDTLPKIESLTEKELRDLANLDHDPRKIHLALSMLGLSAAGNDVRLLQSDQPMPHATDEFDEIFIAASNLTISARYQEERVRKLRMPTVDDFNQLYRALEQSHLLTATDFNPLFKTEEQPQLSSADRLNYVVKALEQSHLAELTEIKMWANQSVMGTPVIFSAITGALRPSESWRSLITANQNTAAAHFSDEEIPGCEKLFVKEVDSLYKLTTATIARTVTNAAAVDKLGLPPTLAEEVKKKAAIKDIRRPGRL